MPMTPMPVLPQAAVLAVPAVCGNAARLRRSALPPADQYCRKRPYWSSLEPDPYCCKQPYWSGGKGRSSTQARRRAETRDQPHQEVSPPPRASLDRCSLPRLLSRACFAFDLRLFLFLLLYCHCCCCG